MKVLSGNRNDGYEILKFATRGPHMRTTVAGLMLVLCSFEGGVWQTVLYCRPEEYQHTLDWKCM